jgi:hypothetical protein
MGDHLNSAIKIDEECEYLVRTQDIFLAADCLSVSRCRFYVCGYQLKFGAIFGPIARFLHKFCCQIAIRDCDRGLEELSYAVY